ncbi:Hypothetical predicted protein [Cloeon dipterum]|uniref:Uncharacterized protein n=1 Tax=Cloeon dipterum TaxID=197152 RepID=A0A8S1DXB7_9INSE|nr:Hypothetical predicted protein [Cloeon dipterum]
MPVLWAAIECEETLNGYKVLNTPLNPILYPAIHYCTRFLCGYYDSANRRSLFVSKSDSGEDVTIATRSYNFLLLCDEENLLEWRQYQHGDLTNGRAFCVPNIGVHVYFGRTRVGNSNPIGQVCEDGFCYIPTLHYGVIKVSDFEILMYRDVEQ